MTNPGAYCDDAREATKATARPKSMGQSVVDLATGAAQEQTPPDTRDPAAVELGRRGGLVGGKARAEKLSAKKRAAIARKAAKSRWDQERS